MRTCSVQSVAFLSIQAQDFIEDDSMKAQVLKTGVIPEHSSSGLH